VLDHWPVGLLLLMPRRLILAESLVDLSRGLLGEFGATHEHFDLAVDPGLDRREPRMNKGRSGNGHPIAPFWLYSRVPHHAEHVVERQQPTIRRGSVGNLTGPLIGGTLLPAAGLG
jgi:hypothetical protein